MGAGLRQDMGRSWGPQAWNQMTDKSPNEIVCDTASQSAIGSNWI